MYQCQFMKLPFERPEEPEIYRTDEDTTLVYYMGERKKVNVPSTYNGVSITTLSPWLYAGNTNIEKLTVPSGITTIL